ncbi:hypothetical protein EVAR_3764_1 [Eumeta japonica]|uniref:Uncharacterized protein n=1 Tax=Eumeta variegata TaxID=151549 RepID=A0A4C1SSH6_EUMVA|nr:hypothetical protein EVAR_3764_1 [Eumeta japonica]
MRLKRQNLVSGDTSEEEIGHSYLSTLDKHLEISPKMAILLKIQLVIDYFISQNTGSRIIIETYNKHVSSPSYVSAGERLTSRPQLASRGLRRIRIRDYPANDN